MKPASRLTVTAVSVGVILMLATLTAVLFLIGKVGTKLNSQSVEEYLPTQTVLNRVPGVDGAAVKIGQTVVIVARKCNITKHTITVKGEGSFAAVEPAGLSVVIGHGQATRKPGCTAKTFKFVIPPSIVERVRTLAPTTSTQIYQIYGTDTPTDGGAVAAWASQPFIIVP